MVTASYQTCVYDAHIYDPGPRSWSMHVCMVYVSMMRQILSDGRTNERTNKAILGVGYVYFVWYDQIYAHRDQCFIIRLHFWNFGKLLHWVALAALDKQTFWQWRWPWRSSSQHCYLRIKYIMKTSLLSGPYNVFPSVVKGRKVIWRGPNNGTGNHKIGIMLFMFTTGPSFPKNPCPGHISGAVCQWHKIKRECATLIKTHSNRLYPINQD